MFDVDLLIEACKLNDPVKFRIFTVGRLHKNRLAKNLLELGYESKFKILPPTEINRSTTSADFEEGGDFSKVQSFLKSKDFIKNFIAGETQTLLSRS